MRDSRDFWLRCSGHSMLCPYGDSECAALCGRAPEAKGKVKRAGVTPALRNPDRGTERRFAER